MNSLLQTAIAAVLVSLSTFASAQEFSVQSPDIQSGKLGEKNFLSESYGFGCTGGNASPALTWSNPPTGTKSYVLTIFDRDAPTGIGSMHWVVVNTPGSARSLAGTITATGANLPPNALQTRTDFGVPGYGGPCPPKGSSHRYEINLTALSVDKLPDAVTANATPALVGFFAKAHALGEAKLTINQGR